MRLPLLLICAAVLASAITSAGAAEGSIWIEGRWENTGGQYQWRQGYWQTSTTTTTVTNAPAQRWVEGHWAQGANGMVWIEGHYQAVPAPVVVSAPTPPPQVVVVQEPRPAPTVVIGASYGYNSGYGYNNGYHAGYGYHHRPACPPARPVVHCPPPRPVVHCPPPRPVVHHHGHNHHGHHGSSRGGVRVSLPRPSIDIVKVGGIKLPVPVFKRR